MIYGIEELASLEGLSVECLGNSNYRIGYKTEYLTNNFLYFSKVNDELKFSFNFFSICSYLREYNITLTPNRKSYSFFIEKGYEPFDSTIIEEIYKLPNLCELKIVEQNWEYQLIDLFEENKENEKELIKRTICKCFDKKTKNIILFSGGYDSTLLAKIAKDYGVEVELVNGAYIDILSSNDSVEKDYSNKLAKYLNLPYKVVEIDQSKIEKDDLEHIINAQPNTAHYSFVFNSIQKEINEENVNIISGQQADSILNFGSTSIVKMHGWKIQGLGELLRRFLYLKAKTIHALIFYLMNHCPIKYKQSSLLVGYRKLPIIKNKEVYNSFVYLYDMFLSKINIPQKVLDNNILFYSMSFLQGSDASGILSIMKSKHHPLPFSDYSLIKYYANKRNSIKDVYYPKKVIHELLKEDKELYSILREKPNILNISYEIRFSKLVKELNLIEYYNILAKKFDISGDITFNKYHLVHCLNEIFN